MLPAAGCEAFHPLATEIATRAMVSEVMTGSRKYFFTATGMRFCFVVCTEEFIFSSFLFCQVFKCLSLILFLQEGGNVKQNNKEANNEMR